MQMTESASLSQQPIEEPELPRGDYIRLMRYTGIKVKPSLD